MKVMDPANQSLARTAKDDLGPASSHSSKDVRGAVGLLTRLYVPLVTIALVLVVGNCLALRSKFDPLTVAQNSRIRFQTGAEETARLDGLTPAEAAAGQRGGPQSLQGGVRIQPAIVFG